MTPVLSLLGLGFLLGLRHATDADHVVAVTTIVSRERRLWASSLIGALWGLGHTTTVFLVGGAIILFDVVVPARVAVALELGVAVMLVVLGVGSLRAPSAAHDAGHDHGPTRLRPVAVGVVHGLAGSAGAALLVLSTIRGASWGLFYLAVFGVGTIAGMMLLTTALGVPFAYTSRRFDGLNAWLAKATGLGSIGFGLFLAYEWVFAQGALAR